MRGFGDLALRVADAADGTRVPQELHIVVPDVNVFLDVASLLGPDWDWKNLSAAVGQYPWTPARSQDRRVDSLRALIFLRSGELVGDHIMETWTSDHILRLVRAKAEQSSTAAIAEDRGLGWSHEQSVRLLDLVYETVESSGGDQINVRIPYGNPPLSHEDGLVYATARDAEPDMFVHRYCLTHDNHFRKASLPGDITMLYPHEFVSFVQRARHLIQVTRIRRRK